MKDKKHLLLKLLCFTFLLGSTAAGGAACKDKPNEPAIPDGYDKHFTDVGSYYADEGETRNTFELTDSTFTLKLGGQTIDGTYLYNGTKLRLVTTDGTIIEATYSEATISFTYGNHTYTFLRNVDYTVKFEMNGGVAQADAKVLNGKKLEKPADPVKTVDGKEFAFIGWYKDSSFKEKYSFDQPVTKDITLYAYFVELLGTEEYTVTFSGFTGAEYPGKTTGRKLFNLPQPGEKDGAKFLGWWYSAYNDGTKLTAKYNEGDAIYENIVLYAVWENSGVSAVSVGEKEISWTSLGVNKAYEITVAKLADDGTEQKVGETTTSSLKYSFDFAAEEAGDYVVTVKSGNSETKAYYKNKTLARVCLFAVKYPSVFTFGAVEGAEKYLLTYECGTENHVHEEIDLGTDTFYDFSGCAMKEGGITFTVTAVAKEGYRNSVSATYTFDGSLATPENFVLDGTNEKLSWSAVKYADYYLLTINDGEAINMGTKTSFDLKGYAKGEYTFKLVAVGRGFNNSVAATATWTKSTLAAPSKPVLNDYTLTWNAVEGAKGYIVKIGDRTIDTDTNAYTFTAGDFAANKTYAISVCAKDEAAAGNSLFGEILTLTTAAELNPEYSNGTLTWNSVVGAKKYEVQVNDGEVFEASYAFAKVTLTTSGNNILRVRSYNAAGEASAWAETTVEAYTVSYNVGDSEQTIADRYYATGDEIALPAPDFNGYDFAGWYDGENGAGTKYELTYGALPVFENDGNLTLYAKWEPKSYQLTLDGGTYNASDLSEGATVKYRQPFTLPVPESNDTNRAFVGWFNGNTQVADQNGFGETWLYSNGMTLTARWVEIFEYEAGNNGYNVKKPADGVRYLTKITIPATYNGKPVLEIKAEAFDGCSNIREINIPNCVTKIEFMAFEDCSALESVKIYEVEGITDPVYYSPKITGANGKTETDGVIIRNDSSTGKTLFFFPRAKTGDNGVYTIPEDVSTISAEVFVDRELTKIRVPASVTRIQTNAFYRAKAKEIEFLAAADGTDEQALTIDVKAFESCTSLEKIVLPARLSQMSLYDTQETKASASSFTSNWSYQQSVFKNCYKLSTIEVTGNAVKNIAPVYSAQNGMLLTGDGKTVLYYPKGKTDTKLVLPDSVTRIENKAFYKASKLAVVEIPERIEYIGESAFEGCENIDTLTFLGVDGSADLRIGRRAFYGCTSILTLTLTENVRYLGEYAFGNTRNLTEVTVNSNGNVVFEEGAFAAFSRDYQTGAITGSGDSKVQTLNIGKGLSGVDISSTFGGTSAALATVRVDKENNYYYEGSDGVIYDKNLDEENVNQPTKILYYPVLKAGEYEVPSTITEIGANVFAQRLKLTKITIGNNVKSIGDHAFASCTALTEIVWLPAREGEETNDLTIGDYAFWRCYNKALTKLTIPARVISIGSNAFGQCDELTEIAFEERQGKELAIGERAFFDCESITEIALPEGVISVGYQAFAACENLVKITFPASVERLGKWTKIEGKDGEPDTYSFQDIELFSTSTMVNPLSISSISANLKEIVVAEGNKRYASKDGMLFGKYEKEDDESTAGADLVRLYFCPFAKEGIVTLPSTLKDIYKQAFAYNTGVTEVTFAGELTGALTIGENALFNATRLVTFKLPQGLEKIQAGLFKNCSGLTTIEIPNTVKSVASGAFEGCTALSSVVFLPGNDETSLTLEDGVGTTSAYTGVFSSYTSSKNLSCTALTSIVFPKRLSQVGAYAFAYCENLTSIDFGENSNVSIIGDGAFIYTGLKTIELGKSSETDASGVLTINLPEKLTEIRARAFAYTKFPENTKVVIPASVTAFGTYSTAASGKRALAYGVFYSTLVKEVEFGSTDKPSQLVTISQYAFYACDSDYARLGQVSSRLESVKFADNSALETIEESAFCENKKLKSVDFGKNSNLKTIAIKAFSECRALESITLPASIETIGVKNSQSFSGAFYNCISLKSITFATFDKNDENVTETQIGKSSLKSIATRTFEGTALTSFTLPETIEVLDIGALGAELFKGCKNLTTINLSSTVKSIANVFDLCGSITAVNLPVDENGNQIGYFRTNDTVIYNQTGTEIVYIVGDVNGTFTVNENVTTIADGVFAGKATLKKIILPMSVASIGAKAFFDCVGLEEVEFATDGDLATIGASAFRNCISLKSIRIPSKVTTLNPYTFFNCRSLTTVELPENLVYIGYYVSGSTQKLSTSGGYVFAHCEKLKEINIPESVKWIQPYSFLNCKSIETVAVNTANNQLGECAFANCSALTSVTIASGISVLPKQIFINCQKLNSVVKTGAAASAEPTADLSSVTNIGANAFQNCVALKSADLSNVTTLGAEAFSGCTLLQEVNLDKVTSFGNKGFQNCTSLNKVTLSKAAGLTKLADYLFDGCTALEEITLPDQLTQLATYTFRNTGLKKVRIPDGVVSLGAKSSVYCTPKTVAATFDGCTQLTYLDLNKVIRIGALTFRNCPLTEVAETLDLSKVEVLGYGSFAGTGLKKADLSSIWFYSTGTSKNSPPMGFGNGDYDTSSLITKTDKEGVFENCKLLTTVIFSTKTGTETVGTQKRTAEVELGSLMFKGCTALTEITLPESSKGFADQAFFGCTALKKVSKDGETGFSSLTASYAFGCCTALESMDLSKATGAVIGIGLFDGCTQLSDLKLNAAVITEIRKNAFRNCSSLVSEEPEVIPANKKYTPFDFSQFTATAGGGYTSCSQFIIGSSAFEGCTGLTKVIFAELKENGKGYPEQISLGANAFKDCTGLKVVSFSKNVIDVSVVVTRKQNGSVSNYYKEGVLGSVFRGCINLEQLSDSHDVDSETTYDASSYNYVYHSTGYIVKNGMLYKSDGKTVAFVLPTYRPTDGVFTLKEDETITANALSGSQYIKKVVLPESMTEIPDKMFQNAVWLEEVVISSKTVRIGNNAFDGSGVKKITYTGAKTDAEEKLNVAIFPETLTYIGTAAFKNTQIEKTSIPASVNYTEVNTRGVVSVYSVADNAFYGSALKSVTIEGSETYFGASAFENCTNLTNVQFLSDTSPLGKKMFAGCTALAEIRLPEKATSLGEAMFLNCTNLASVNIPENVTEIPSSGVFMNTAITSIVIPEGVTEIKGLAFNDCAKLESVTFPSTLQTLASSFKNCVSLKEVVLPEGLTNVNGFAGCTNLTKINIPSTVTKIDYDAFTDCTALKSIVIPASVETVSGISGGAFGGWTVEQTIYIEKSPSEVYNLWHTDSSNSGFGWLNYLSSSSGITQIVKGCRAKIVWNYSPEATTAGENAK